MQNRLAIDKISGVLTVNDSGLNFAPGNIIVETDDAKIKFEGSADSCCAGYIDINVSEDQYGLAAAVTNNSSREVKVSRIVFNLPPAGPGSWMDSAEYTQYTHALVPAIGDSIIQVNREDATRKDTQSHGLTVLHNRLTGRSLLLGSAGRGECITSFQNIYAEPHRDSGFGIRIVCDFSCTLAPGKILSTPPIIALAGDDALELLREYGKIWSRLLKVPVKPAITGWNSWDYYAGTIREVDLVDNMLAAKRDYPEVKYMAIDDGWQEQWGEWELNRRFPAEFSQLVQKINAEGFEAGLWIAPLSMSIRAPFAFWNQDALVRDGQGNIAFQPYAGSVVHLDPTHPKAKEFLTHVFTKIKDAGVKYIKLDFMQALLESNAVQFYNRGKGKMGIMQETLELIRSIMGEDTYIVSGVIPMEATVGLLDACRMASDISNFWGHIRRNATQTAACFWMQNQLWNNDPDFLIVRSKTTSSDKYFKRPVAEQPYNSKIPWMDGRMANEEELKTWATVLMLSGGDMVLSDNLSTLNDRGREIIRKAFAFRLAAPALPVDLFDCPGAPPSTWIGEKDGSKVLALFNWSEGPADFIPGRQPGIAPGKALDFWSGEEIDVDAGANIRVAPHGVKLLIFK